MANKDLFKQAIAEAKSVREAAIANAKEALEETLTPHLKDMLAAKLQEMEDSSVEEEVVNESEEVEEVAEETINEEKVEESTDEEVNEEESVEEAMKDDDKKDESIDEAPAKDDEMDEAKHDDAKDEAIEEEDLTEVEPVEAAEEEAEDDSEESDDEAEHDEEPEGDEDISNLTVDQFKDMIRDIIAQEVGGDAAADDMDAGDIEPMGDEEDAIEEPEMAGDEEEIDLDELLAELEATEESVEEAKHDDDKKDEEVNEEETVEEVSTANSTEVQDTANAEAQGTNVNRTVKEEVNEEVTEEKSELDQALETIETLKSELNEVNILNSKLLYVNKIFKSNNLSESQKVNIIAAFDKAETVKEVKLVFETVSDNIVDVKKENVSEAKVKGMASKATGTTASKPEGEIVLSEAAQRMQKLAGIIK